MKPLALLTILVVALAAAAATSAAWTPTRQQLDNRRHNVMDNREAKCLHTWSLNQLAPDLFPRQLRWKWGWWTDAGQRTAERDRQCTPYELGKRLAERRGWTDAEFDAADYIISRESSWIPCRHYPSTTSCSYTGPSACGIPQAVPCSKLLDACGATRLGQATVRCQIKWTFGYMDGRYDGPIQAKAHKVAYGWY